MSTEAETGGSGHKPRRAWSHQKLEGARDDSPLELERESVLPTPWF